MESIQTDEETRPLATPPLRRRVADAYASNSGASFLKKNGVWIFAFFAFLLFSSGGSDQKKNKRVKNAKRLRKQAEIAPIEVIKEVGSVEKQQEMNVIVNPYEDSTISQDSTPYNNDDYEGEDDLEEEIGTAMADVDEAEEEEIEINDSMLVSAVRNLEDSVKFYLGRVFGYGDDFEDVSSEDDTSGDVKLTEDQLDIIAKKISERLEMDVKKEFRAKADAITEEKVDVIDQVVAEDRDAHMNPREIADDVAEVETVVVEDLKDEIDEAAVRVKESLPERVRVIRNEVVQEVTGKKLDEIESFKRRKKEKKQELLKKFREMEKKMKQTTAEKKDKSEKKSMKRNNEKVGVIESSERKK